MLTDERKTLLLDLLARDGRLIARDVALHFGLSEDTIRRDLRELAALGRLTRVHGGALPASPTHIPLAERRPRAIAEKQRLAQTALGFLRPGMMLFLDGGTTNAALAAQLPRVQGLTVVTHSPVIAAALEDHDATVILIGGVLFRHSMVATGARTQAEIAQLRPDLFVMGVTGIAAVAGLTTGDYEEAAIKRAAHAVAVRTIVMVTEDKIGAASPCRICAVADVSAVIACGPVPPGIAAETEVVTA